MSVDAPPLTPDAETARRWAVDELAKDDYTQGGESWLTRISAWFLRMLEGFGDGVGGTLGAIGVIVAVAIGVALVAVVVWLVVGPLRRSRRSTVAGELFDDDRTADALEESARTAAAAGDWGAATADLYRAIIRRLADRDVIALSEGQTAHEAAAAAGDALPALAARIAVDADAFDRIRYGRRDAHEGDFRHAEETMRACASARRRVEVDAG